MPNILHPVVYQCAHNMTSHHTVSTYFSAVRCYLFCESLMTTKIHRDLHTNRNWLPSFLSQTAFKVTLLICYLSFFVSIASTVRLRIRIPIWRHVSAFYGIPTLLRVVDFRGGMCTLVPWQLDKTRLLTYRCLNIENSINCATRNLCN